MHFTTVILASRFPRRDYRFFHRRDVFHLCTTRDIQRRFFKRHSRRLKGKVETPLLRIQLPTSQLVINSSGWTTQIFLSSRTAFSQYVRNVWCSAGRANLHYRSHTEMSTSTFTSGYDRQTRETLSISLRAPTRQWICARTRFIDEWRSAWVESPRRSVTCSIWIPPKRTTTIMNQLLLSLKIVSGTVFKRLRRYRAKLRPHKSFK